MLLKIGLVIFWFIIIFGTYCLCVASGEGSRKEEYIEYKNNYIK